MGSKFQIIFSLILISFLISCSNGITGKIVQETNLENDKPQVYFCPRDDCGLVFERYIGAANSSVYCAFYDIELKGLINSLSVKSSTIDVKLVIDATNYNEQIKGDGVRMNVGGQLMHDKFCVIDEQIILTGSFNPTYNDNDKNNNNVLVFHSRILARNYLEEFQELWDGYFGGGNRVNFHSLLLNNMTIRNYFCPEDDCATNIIEEIKNARKSIFFMSFSFTNERIADALSAKDDLDVRGILEKRQSSSKYSQLNRLNGFGIDAKTDNNKYTMHHKVFIIDNETVITGSFNPTLSADRRNDENILIIKDKEIAKKFLDEFDFLWES